MFEKENKKKEDKESKRGDSEMRVIRRKQLILSLSAWNIKTTKWLVTPIDLPFVLDVLKGISME